MKSAVVGKKLHQFQDYFEVVKDDSFYWWMKLRGAIFSQPPLISFRRGKSVGNFLVKSTFKTIEKPGTFKCARSRCKTCPFAQNANKISGPERSVKITDRFTCTSANVIYCITCTLCKKLYIGETGRRLGNRFREHLRDVEKDDKDASKPVTQHFNLPNHSKEHMSICSLSLHQGTTDSRKTPEQRFIFQIGTFNPHGINKCFSLINLLLFSHNLFSTNSIAPCSVYKPYTTHNSSIRSDQGLMLETSAFQSLYGGQFTLSTLLINQIFVYHSPTDAAPQFLQKLIPFTHLITIVRERIYDVLSSS